MTTLLVSRRASRPASRHVRPSTSTLDVTALRDRVRRPWEVVVAGSASDFEAMIGWYAKVLGVTPCEHSSNPTGRTADAGFTAVWVANEETGHRIVIVVLPRRADDRRRSPRQWDQHAAFEYPSLADLMAAHARLKDLGSEPFLSAGHGKPTAFYYEDPEGNSVELTADDGVAGVS
jgi:catechol-2,3-dioxygenase